MDVRGAPSVAELGPDFWLLSLPLALLVLATLWSALRRWTRREGKKKEADEGGPGQAIAQAGAEKPAG